MEPGGYRGSGAKRWYYTGILKSIKAAADMDGMNRVWQRSAK